MVSVLGPLFLTAGHTVRTQHGERASTGQLRGDVKIRNYLRDQAGSRSLALDLSITHDRCGSSSHVQQNGLLSHPQDLDAPLRLAAQRKVSRSIARGNNTLTIRTFIFSPPSQADPPACTANFCVFYFYRPRGDQGALHSHWNSHWNAIATQPIGLVPFQARGILPVADVTKSKVGLAAAKATAFRINLNVEGCGIVAAQCTLPLALPFFSPSPLPTRTAL
jgi:hypothetical protein